MKFLRAQAQHGHAPRLRGADGQRFAGLLRHDAFQRAGFFLRAVDKLHAPRTDDALVEIAVGAGNIAVLEGVRAVHFESHARVEAQKVEFAPLSGAMQIKHRRVAGALPAEVHRHDIGRAAGHVQRQTQHLAARNDGEDLFAPRLHALRPPHGRRSSGKERRLFHQEIVQRHALAKDRLRPHEAVAAPQKEGQRRDGGVRRHGLSPHARFETVAERRGHPAVLKVLVHIEAVEIAACVDVAKADDFFAREHHQRNVLRQ